MLFKEKGYEDAVKDMAKDPVRFSSFLTSFAVDVRGEMNQDDKDAFDFYVQEVLPVAIISGGDKGEMAVAMLKSIVSHIGEEEGGDDEAEHK